MDPFSISLGVITIVQALKGLIDLAQKIDEGFAKVSNNMESVKRLSENILQTLNRLRTFYEAHEENLRSAKEVQEIILGLKSEMEIVYKKCNALFSPPAKGKIARTKAAFNAWMNRNKVEADIKALKIHVQECFITTTAFATLQTTAVVHQIFTATTRIEATATPPSQQLLVLNERQLDNLREMGTTLAKLDTVDGRTKPQPKQSDSSGNSSATEQSERISNISEQVVAEMYLRHKVKNIAQSLAALAKSETFRVEDPLDDYTRPFQSIISLDTAFADRSDRYDEVVSKTLGILSILRDRSHSLSIQEGAWDMVNLAIALYKLEMYSEAVVIGTWTVDLFRTLAKSEPSVYEPYLGLSLLNLSRYYYKVENIAQATSTIVECVQLNRQMQSTYQTQELRDQLGRALMSSSFIAQKARDRKKALHDATESVEIFEGIMKELAEWEKAFDSVLTEEPTSTVEETGGKVEEIRSAATSVGATATLVDEEPVHKPGESLETRHKFLLDYGSALHQLSFCQEEWGKHEDSCDTEQRAIEHFRTIQSLYPGNFLDTLAEASYRMSLDLFRDFISEEKALEYAKEATSCYCALLKRSTVHSLEYYNSLWEYASILGTLRRYDEALVVWHQMADLARETITDQIYIADACRQISWSLRRLNRYEEAITFRSESVKGYRVAFETVSRYEADGLNDLAVELHLANRSQEAIQTQQEAVAHYRVLVMQEPATFSKKLADALAQLASYLSSVRDYDDALNEGCESMSLYKQLDLSDEVIAGYVYSLRVNINAAFESDNEDIAIQRSQECIHHFKRLFTRNPDMVRDALAGGYSTHGFKLNKHHKVQEAIKWAEDSLKWYEEQPLDRCISVTDTYLATLINMSDDLTNLGKLRKAFECINKAIQAGKKLCADQGSSVAFIACALLNRADMLLDFGKWEEAFVATTEALDYAKAHPTEDVTQLSGILYVHGIALARLEKWGEAMTVTEEALEVSRTAPMEKIAKSNMFAPLQLPRCLRSVAEMLADLGDEKKALEHAQEAYDEIMKFKTSKTYSLPWTFVEVPHGACALTLTTRLLANGRAEEAFNHLQEMSTSFCAKSKDKPGNYPRYLSILTIFGWCCCYLDKHEEGTKAYAELESLRARLKFAFPEISDTVDVELLKEARRPNQKALWRQLDLKCGHQKLLDVP